jgi:hypothetical protein
MPATSAEIRRVLALLDTLSRVMGGETDVPKHEASADMGAVLRGLVLGFEGAVFPLPGDDAGDLGYRVAQTLTRGGTPWL